MKSTNIEWTDATMNFWNGCKKVSEGCRNCYMFRMKEKYKQSGATIYRAGENKFTEAMDWEEPKRIFTCSMSDFFLEEADEWREDAWNVIRYTKQHTWLILTKRPERIKQCLPKDWGDGWDNVWLGVTVENQKCFERAAILADIPAKIRFISAEPLLEPIDFLQEIDGVRVIDNFDWVIVGGESGNEFGKYQYRPCKVEWIEKVITDLKEHTSVAVFNKQLGSFLKKELKLKGYHGSDMSEWPKQLRIREFPKYELEKV